MTRRQALGRAWKMLRKRRIEDAPLESEVLLRHVLKIDRARLYLDLEAPLDAAQAEAFWRLIERRARGEPTAYLTGHREFYGLDFCVDPGVLIPRPESELLVEKALSLARQKKVSTVADIGTGCGAIAVCLALHLGTIRIYATDISPEALEVARLNRERYGVTDRIELRCGDLLGPLPEPVDLIVANLPYVRKSDLAEEGPLYYEPARALDGGESGLKEIERLCRQAGPKLRPAGCLLLEIGRGQREAVTGLLRELFPAGKLEIDSDLAGIERVVSLCLTS